MPQPADIELVNLKGEILFLRTVVRFLMDQRYRQSGPLEDYIDAERKRLGDGPGRIPFEHANNQFHADRA